MDTASDLISRRYVSSRARAALATLSAAALAAGGLLLTAAPAAGHAVLIGSSPEDGETVAEPPTEVRLEFNEPVHDDFTQIAVLDADENHYEAGDPEVDGTDVIQSVADLGPGEYVVSYRVGSADGHPVSGTIEFTVSESAEQAPSPATEEPGDTEESGASDDAADTATPAPAADDTEPSAAATDNNTPLWLGAAAVVAVAVAAAVMLIRRRPGAEPDDSGADTGR